MSKKQRWQETLVNAKTNNPTQKKGGKELTSLPAPGGKQAGSNASKNSVSSGRSNSLGRGSDFTATVSKVGGSVNRGSLSHLGSVGHPATKQASHTARAGPRLCSSRSFSSLHTTSLTAAPFMRSSRSLNRLDQRSAGDDSDHAVGRSQAKKDKASGKKTLNTGRLSSSLDKIRGSKESCHGDNADRMKTSSSLQPAEPSSSLVSTSAHHHHCIKGKKLTTDGVYTLCAMTAGMKRNWVHAVFKNVRPSFAHDTTSSRSEPETQQLQGHRTSSQREASHQQQEKDSKVQVEKMQSSANGNSSSSLLAGSPGAPAPTDSPSQVEEEGTGAHQCPVLSGTTQTDASSCGEGCQSDSSTSAVVLSNDECFDDNLNTQSVSEHQTKHTLQREDQQVSINSGRDCTKDKQTLACEQQTGQLVKELEQTQRELSQLQQLNRNLKDELQREKEIHSREWFGAQDATNSSSQQALALQRLQKINQDLRFELEAQKRSHEEAREAELQQRVDLLAQQAQLLVTGDATVLAQAHLKQERQRFQDQQVEWEQCVTSLKSQLNISEEQRKETESRLSQLQQELDSYQSLQQEAERLRKNLDEVSAKLHTYEETQAQKDTRLQKHLVLLQASQERERRSLTASLAQAEQHSQDLQEKLDRSEQQVESLTKSQTWTREIEVAQRQLQEELARTISAVQRLQEEREQVERHCQELQDQLSETDREVSRLQDRLKTEETHYYNLEHTYERVCEELQVALGKLRQRESETQDIREGYERQLDRKEQELSEVLLKMEVLGNSLEETEVKLNEVLKACTCASSRLGDNSSEIIQHKERQQQTTPHFTVNESTEKDSYQLFNWSNTADVSHINGDNSNGHGRTGSRSLDESYQYFITAGDDPERFMSVIQLLETKLYVTEEKLRDITQRLEEHQSHINCRDPQLCSQLTQSRATAQHLSLLLHSQAKQSQRFAQETENHCRMLVGKFQVAVNIIQACRERLHATPLNIPDLEKQLATVAACLQQGEKDALKQQHESYNVSKGEGKILNDEKSAGAESNTSKSTNTWSSLDDTGSVEKCLMMELFVVEKIASVLQSQHGQLSSISRKDEGEVAQRYKNIITQRITLKAEERTQSERTECDTDDPLESSIYTVCAEAELIYAASKIQQQYESVTQVKGKEVEDQMVGLADISPSELAPYEEQVQVDAKGLKEDAKPAEEDQSDDKKGEAEKKPDWLERLISRLQRRAKFLHQLCQVISDDSRPVSEDGMEHKGKKASAFDLKCLLEQAKLIYLSERIYMDLKQEFQSDMNKLQEQGNNVMDDQEALNDTICQLQEDNGMLRKELELAEQKMISVKTGNQRLLEDIQKIEDYHTERMEKLEREFQEKIKELQQIHEEEMKHLHGYYTKSCVSREKQTKSCTEAAPFVQSTSSLPEQTLIERKTKEDFGIQMKGGDAVAMREAYQKDLENLQASCDQGLTAMEEMHRNLIEDLQQQHQKEVAELLKEKEQLLQEETAATMAAIVAIRRAHRQELEKSRQSQRIMESADITQLHSEYEKEVQLLHKELEMLSVQHTEKCLESSQLREELQDERKSMMQCQKENQELKNKQVILRAREAEIQFLRQEAHSLKEELKIAQMDKIYAENKLKITYTNSQDDLHQHVNNIGEHFKFSTWSPRRVTSGQSHEDSATNTNSATFPKKSSLVRQIRAVRSKSLKEGLSVQERMKLFESF
ncbi:nuclear mitotic apparatus protein 1 [Archocentrus centrarchus]|uniref:nuclear mitotic apparatus protein 1 n=1 Tax=Archocentrus centrarchus TaxID=63155 RepID=UPI0011E9C28C|nr:nuclear mitotic apparatus protein 1-like [Archocentrus centrarchus]